MCHDVITQMVVTWQQDIATFLHSHLLARSSAILLLLAMPGVAA